MAYYCSAYYIIDIVMNELDRVGNQIIIIIIIDKLGMTIC